MWQHMGVGKESCHRLGVRRTRPRLPVLPGGSRYQTAACGCLQLQRLDVATLYPDVTSRLVPQPLTSYMGCLARAHRFPVPEKNHNGRGIAGQCERAHVVAAKGPNRGSRACEENGKPKKERYGVVGRSERGGISRYKVSAAPAPLYTARRPGKAHRGLGCHLSVPHAQQFQTPKPK